MTTPLVSIITVNFNQTAVTCELLASLQKITYPNVEIWVVDNASKESPQATINTLYPQVKVIVSEKNLGFAGGNNLAIKQAQGDFLMFLNNDTEVSPSFLEPLVNVMLTKPDVGICASKIHYFHTPNMIQFAGSTPLHPLRMASTAIGGKEMDKGQFDVYDYTNLAHGAAMMVRHEAIKKVGMMPEEYFLYYEEIDWCEQIKQGGYKIFFVPNSLVYHKESVSVGRQSSLQIYYKTRNRILLARRWRKGFAKFLTFNYLGLVAARDLSKYLASRNTVFFRTYLKAISWHFSGK